MRPLVSPWSVGILFVKGAINNNFPDYLGIAQSGQFWTEAGWGGDTAQTIVDTNGEAKFIFRVGMQPGNNYRVVASLLEPSMITGIQVTTSTAPKSRIFRIKTPLWVCHLTAPYQGPMDADMDPSGIDETIRLGETADHGGIGHSAVYMEDCRETFGGVITGINGDQARLRLKKWIAATAAHEIAHQPGTQTPEQDHAEAKLMSKSNDDVSILFPENAIFSPKTVLRFRTSNRWSE